MTKEMMIKNKNNAECIYASDASSSSSSRCISVSQSVSQSVTSHFLRAASRAARSSYDGGPLGADDDDVAGGSSGPLPLPRALAEPVGASGMSR